MPGFGGQYLEDLMQMLQERGKYIYLISRQVQTVQWYFFDLENEEPPYRVAWVPYISPAYKFPSEQAVEEFKMEYILPRKVDIIRLERKL